MSKLSLNTHDYDKEARSIYTKLVAADPHKDQPLVEFAIVLQQIFLFVRDFKTNKPGTISPPELQALKHQAYQALVLFKQDTRNNRDQFGLTVEDILPRVWRALDRSDPDSIIYFVEQLSDIKTMGSCNNGRINRLLQVYNCLVPVN